MRQPEKMDIRAALPAKPAGFLDQLRVFIRSNGLAYTTEKTYVLWLHNFIKYSKYKSAKDFKLADVEVYLNHLTQQRFCSPNTQATVLNALVFYIANL